MFLGFNDSLKAWKKDLKTSGADMSALKAWQKVYDKVMRQEPQMEKQYIQAKSELESVHTLLLELEDMLVAWKEQDQAVMEIRFVQKIGAFSNEMKQYQDNFHHEFFISQYDEEFHLTYKTLLQLCDSMQRDFLILQSEVDNLLAMVKEALAKEQPDYRALTFYYLERKEEEIYDIPHSDKVDKIKCIYESEFLQPIRQMLLNCYGEEKTSQIMEVDLWKR